MLHGLSNSSGVGNKFETIYVLEWTFSQLKFYILVESESKCTQLFLVMKVVSIHMFTCLLGRSVGIVSSRTKGHGVCFVLAVCYIRL
jgi:hypothetical protein